MVILEGIFFYIFGKKPHDTPIMSQIKYHIGHSIKSHFLKFILKLSLIRKHAQETIKRAVLPRVRSRILCIYMVMCMEL